MYLARSRFAKWTAVLVLLTCVSAHGQEADLAAAFKTARPDLNRQLRDRSLPTRLAAVRELEKYPLVESARLLLPGLTNSDEDFRQATFEALGRMSSEPDVYAFIKQSASKQWKLARPRQEDFALIAILLASELPDVQQDAAKLLTDAGNRPVQGRIALIDLADALGAVGGDCACRALVQLTALPRFTDDFGFRRSVEQALARLRTRPAVTALVKMLADAKGEVRADIATYLAQISGQDFGAEHAVWAEWWRDKEATFEFPPPPAQQPLLPVFAPLPRLPQIQGPLYYNLPLTAAKIVFVIDCSGSMRGLPIAAAKRELARAVEALPADVEFNLIAFNSKPTAWQRKLVPASPEFKQNALYFIGAQQLASGTASYDALEAALRFDAEAIYFLTDGAPFGGKITNSPEIVRAISGQNRYRRLSINALGINVGFGGSPFEQFLTTLAQQNHGRFERVDQ